MLRKIEFKYFHILTFVLFMTIILAACGQSNGTTNGEEGESNNLENGENTVIVAINEDAESLDPHKNNQVVSHQLTRILFDRLVYIDENSEPQPWLAESWEISDDSKEITFKLRDDVKFHNGDDLDANDVKFTFDRMMDPETASPTGDQMVGPLETVEVVDEYTVKFIFGEPFASFFMNLYSGYSGILPEDLAGKGDDFGRDPVGSGPFVFKEWNSGSEIIFEKNPDYNWGREKYDPEGAAQLDEIVYKIIPDEGTRMAALETGEIQIAGAPLELTDKIEANDDLKLIKWEDATNYYSIEFNVTKEPFNNKDVRTAIAHAINSEEIIEGAWSGYAVKNDNPLGVGLLGYNPEVGEQYGAHYDVEKSKEILQDVGYTLGSDGMFEYNGDPIKFTMLTSNNSVESRAAQIIQSQLREAGIDVEVQVIEGSSYRPTQQEGKHDFHLQRWNWTDPSIISMVFKEGGMVGLYENAELDEVLIKSDEEMDTEERVKYLEEAQKMVLEDVAVVPILTEYVMDVSRVEVEGYEWDSTGHSLWLNVTVK